MKKQALYFSAEWCLPCKSFKPLAMPMLDSNGIDVIQLDAETATDAVREREVMMLPTIVFINGEDEVARVTGASMKQLKEALEIVRRSNG
jgi:thiol-disulfide isomerase/thioredoxin